MEPVTTNNEIQNEAAQILQDEAFQRYIPKDEPFDLMKWLMEHIDFDLPFSNQLGSWDWKLLGFLLKWFFILAAVAIVGYLLYLAVKKLLFAPEDDVQTCAVSQKQREEAREDYAKRAAEAFKHQDYRLAVHSLFLATVMMVIEDAFFKGTDSLTNREIASVTDFSRFPQAGRLNEVFYEMVYFDEPRWFGRQQTSLDDYQAFWDRYQEFLKRLGANYA